MESTRYWTQRHISLRCTGQCWGYGWRKSPKLDHSPNKHPLPKAATRHLWTAARNPRKQTLTTATTRPLNASTTSSLSLDNPLSQPAYCTVRSPASNDSSNGAYMPVTFNSSPRGSQQTCAAAVTDSKPLKPRTTQRGPRSKCIDQVKVSQVGKLAEPASITFRWQTLFNKPCSEDDDEMAAAACLKAFGLWKFDDSVPQPPALEHVTYSSPTVLLLC